MHHTIFGPLYNTFSLPNIKKMQILRYIYCSDKFYTLLYLIKMQLMCLEVLTQLTNAEIARQDVVTQVRTRDLTVVCEFNFSG